MSSIFSPPTPDSQNPAVGFPFGSKPAVSEAAKDVETDYDRQPPSIPTSPVGRATHAGKLKVSKRDLLGMTTQLAIMMKTGVDLASALESLARQSRSDSLRATLVQIHDDVSGGKSISESLKCYPKIFSESYVAVIASGEVSGNLPEVLNQQAMLQRNEMRLHSTVRTMLAYPVLLASVAGIVILCLVLFVLPRFAGIFADFDTPLPVVTRMLLAISTELRERFWVWIPVVVGSIVALGKFFRSRTGRRKWDYFVLHAPIVRDVTRPLLIGHTCRMLGTMIESGVPLVDSLRLTRTSVSNSLYRDLVSSLETNVVNGLGLGDSLLDSKFVPGEAAEMIMTAERTASMGPVTQLIGEHYEEEGETKLRELVAIIEPVITVVMGVIVATIVMSVMLPMFDLATLAQEGH